MALILLVFFSVSAAIIFHLLRYSPEEGKSTLLISVYVAVSFILLILSVTAFFRIDWDNLI